MFQCETSQNKTIKLLVFVFDDNHLLKTRMKVTESTALVIPRMRSNQSFFFSISCLTAACSSCTETRSAIEISCVTWVDDDQLNYVELICCPEEAMYLIADF